MDMQSNQMSKPESREPLLTVLLPVYGRSDLLQEALASVLALNDSENIELLIADDGSDAVTEKFLQSWVQDHPAKRVQWIRRPQNIGLFANLNQAILDASSEWVLLLCSDDKLNSNAVQRINTLRERWSGTELILSTFESINADGSQRPAVSAEFHDQVRASTGLVEPRQMLPALLQLGSLNGNLTGMSFSRSLWKSAGPFREDWRHAADWEWLMRAAEQGPLLLNRIPIASVRTHEAQLSNRNRRSGHELKEVASVVHSLLHHPLLRNQPNRERWAAHQMQYQLWNLGKSWRQSSFRGLLQGVLAIHRSTGLRQTSMSLLKWLPTRWGQHLKSKER